MATENIKQLYEDKQKTKEAYPRVWLPVGSLYWNENDISADISKYFVGTWERVKDVFILAAGDKYAAKSSGGEATHKLTVNEMPSHGHSLKFDQSTNGGTAWVKTGGNSGGPYYSNEYIGNTGGSQAHNNMPPYYCAYCWKRIS